VQYEKSEDVLELMDMAGLDLWLEPGTITRDQARCQTTIDLVLASGTLEEIMVACEVNQRMHVDSITYRDARYST
jgi:hypothetical protein